MRIQDSTLRATSMLRPVISKPSRASRAGNDAAELSEDLQSKKHWRENPIHFRFKAACRIPPGLVDISPAWFNQGRTVCNSCFLYIIPTKSSIARTPHARTIRCISEIEGTTGTPYLDCGNPPTQCNCGLNFAHHSS